MTNIRLGGYTVDDATEIKRRVLGLANSQKMLDGKKQLTVQNQQYYVKLLEPLDAATNPETGYTQANARILRYVQPVDPNSLDMEEVGTGNYELIKITNRYVDFSASSDTVLRVDRMGSEWSPAKSGGKGAEIISFAIVSSDPTLRKAQVEIRQRTFSGTVYGSTLEDSVVQVYDTDGCYLNEPNVDLTGRLGKAVLMLVDSEAQAAHFPTGTVPPKYWNVISLCCPSIVCEV